MREGMKRVVARVVLVAFFSLTLFSCGGGGGGGGAPGGSTSGPDTTAPTVSSTSSANGATGVAVNAAISVIFSEPMDAATINAATFTVKAGTTAVPGTVNYSGTTATFTPTGNWANSTSYTATVTTGVKDLAGNALSTNYVWNFSTGTGTASVVTSLDKIGTAEIKSVIDHDTALLYTLYVAFDPTSLPVEYRGDDSDVMIEGTTVLLELASRLDQLPADLQTKVRSFLLRPDDPLSVWNKRLNELLGASSSPAQSGPVKLAATTPITWDCVDSSNTRVRVKYADKTSWSTLTFADALFRATWLASEIDASGMWNKEKYAMLGTEPCGDGGLGGGDNRLDVYILPSGVGLNWDGRVQNPLLYTGGITVPGYSYPKCGFEPYIVLNGSNGDKYMKAAMAHELFHAFQLRKGMPNGVIRPDQRWWMESSATWAIDLVYPTLNFEQNFLLAPNNGWSITFPYDGPLDDFRSDPIAANAAYIWPFYLVQRAGGDPTVVGKLWEQSASMPPLQAMANLPDWKEAYKQFALWNWNAPPVVKYNDSGEDIPNLVQLTSFFAPDGAADSAGAVSFSKDVSLAKTQITYVEMEDPPPPAVKQLEFDQSEFVGEAGWGLQAIINQKRVEDWSSKAERKFCLAIEPVTTITLVASNSNIDASGKIEGKLKMKELTTPCGNWSGTFSFTRIFGQDLTYTKATVSYSGTITWIPTYRLPWEDRIEYTVGKASGTTTVDATSLGCTAHGQKAWEYTYDPLQYSESPSSLMVFPDGSYFFGLSGEHSEPMITPYGPECDNYPVAIGIDGLPFAGEIYTPGLIPTLFTIQNNRMQGSRTWGGPPAIPGGSYEEATLTWDFGEVP